MYSYNKVHIKLVHSIYIMYILLAGFISSYKLNIGQGNNESQYFKVGLCIKIQHYSGKS